MAALATPRTAGDIASGLYNTHTVTLVTSQYQADPLLLFCLGCCRWRGWGGPGNRGGSGGNTGERFKPRTPRTLLSLWG